MAFMALFFGCSFGQEGHDRFAVLFKDTTLRLLPAQGGLSREEALEMVRELKTWPLLDGFRGRPKADVDAL